MEVRSSTPNSGGMATVLDALSHAADQNPPRRGSPIHHAIVDMSMTLGEHDAPSQALIELHHPTELRSRPPAHSLQPPA